MDRIVICMKWGTLYGPDYVNVLYNATRANLSGDFRFVCLTDDPAGIDSAVECLPIPDLGLPEDLWRVGAWAKVGLFSKDLHGLRGRALFIDLDMVIWGDLDGFFTHGSGLVAVDEGRWNGTPPSTMSSIMAFDLGRYDHLVKGLRADPVATARRHGLEQRYIHDRVEGIGYWPEDWVASFKRHLRRPLLVDRVLAPKRPLPGTRVVIFHGRPRPYDLIRPGGRNRDIWPHHIPGSVGWMQDYWTRNGGSMNG